MKKLLIIITMLFLSTAVVQAAAFDKDIKFRTTKIHLSSDKPIGTGYNTFILALKQSGKVPAGAKVDVKAFMPAMPGMPAMESKVQGENLGNGKYEVKLNIAMSGTWQIHIFITPTKGKKTRVKTSINF
jgi:hypothetical protein